MQKRLKKLIKLIELYPQRSALILATIFTIVGLILLIAYKDMPLVRNSSIYARIIFNIDDLGSKFSSSNDAYNKPLGLAYLTYPFYKLTNATIGLKIVSFLATSLWGFSLIVFFKRFAPKFKVRDTKLFLFLLITFVNPLVIYQFISSYADMLYALSFLWSAYFLDRLFSKDIKWFDGIAFSLIALASIWVKHNGYIIFPLLLIFIVAKYKEVWSLVKSNKMYRYSYFIAVGSVSALIGLLVFLQSNETPYFNLGQNSGNFLGGQSRLDIISTNLIFFGIFLIFSFNVLLLTYNKLKITNENKIWLINLLVFLISLWWYHGTKFNIRYYLSVFPFFVLIFLSNWSRHSFDTQKFLLGTFLIINILLSLLYNNLWIHAKVSEKLDIPVLDNLRLTFEQKNSQENINAINKSAADKNIKTLIFISNYYGDGSHKIWEREGYLNEDISVIYTQYWNREILTENSLENVIVYDEQESFKDDKVLISAREEVTGDVFIVTSPRTP